MWSFKKTTSVFVLILILLVPISCGFKPLYSQLKDQPYVLGTLQISKIAGKEGYHLREALIKRFGEPKKEAYNLHLTIETTKLNEVITPSNEITSYRLIMIAKYSITTKNGVEVLPIQKSIARTGFGSASNSTGYKTQIAEEAAKKRLALKIAEEISTRLLILSEKWLQ